MKKISLLALMSMFAAGSMQAQIWVTEYPFNATGVSNDGIVVGHVAGERQPFFL